MKWFRILFVVVCPISILVPSVVSGAPQDNWCFVEKWGSNGSGNENLNLAHGMDLGTNGLLYIADCWNNRVQVCSLNGTFVTNWGGMFRPCDVAVATNGTVFVADTDNHRIRTFTPMGTSITNWGGSGSTDGKFWYPRGVAVGKSGNVFVADSDINRRVQVFDQSGNFIRKWGSQGSLDGQFEGNIGLDIGPDGLVYVINDGGVRRIQIFDEDGNFVRKLTKPSDWSGPWSEPITVIEDLIFVRDLGIMTMDGKQVTRPSAGDRAFGVGIYAHGVVARPDGTLYVVSRTSTSSAGIIVLRERYRTMGPAVPNAPPRPFVVMAEQRPGTGWMDIDYKVIDADSSNVAVAALGYIDGKTGLASVVKMSTFVENTHTNVGVSVAANQKHRLTWNVAADLSTNYVNLQVEILAKDNRNIMDLDYITIPTNGPNPDLTISCIPLNDADMIFPWYWLVATNDTAINLVSGKVYGVHGVYSNQILASGISTTSNGVDFLLERLHVRRATLSEVSRAKTASSSGVTNQWTPRNDVGGRPSAINEYGFDTGDTGYWVVPLP